MVSVIIAAPSAVAISADLDTGFLQHLGDRGQVVAPGADQFDAPAGARHRHCIGAGLDAVGDDLMVGLVQALDAAHGQCRAADAVDIRAHCRQAAGKVADLGLAGGVLDHRLAGGQAGCHQHVLGCADRNHGKDDPGAGQAARRNGADIAVTELDLGAEAGQALEVEVDRPGADRTSAGQGHHGSPMASQ
jgi:hypothetical protein